MRSETSQRPSSTATTSGLTRSTSSCHFCRPVGATLGRLGDRPFDVHGAVGVEVTARPAPDCRGRRPSARPRTLRPSPKRQGDGVAERGGPGRRCPVGTGRPAGHSAPRTGRPWSASAATVPDAVVPSTRAMTTRPTPIGQGRDQVPALEEAALPDRHLDEVVRDDRDRRRSRRAGRPAAPLPEAGVLIVDHQEEGVVVEVEPVGDPADVAEQPQGQDPGDDRPGTRRRREGSRLRSRRRPAGTRPRRGMPPGRSRRAAPREGPGPPTPPRTVTAE